MSAVGQADEVTRRCVPRAFASVMRLEPEIRETRTWSNRRVRLFWNAMRSSHTFDLAARPDQVVAYLSNPRNLIVANNPGPTVEQSDPPIRTGSWAVLAFDQLRMRVEYSAFEPPARIDVSVQFTGRGSGGTRAGYKYHLEPIQATGGTTLTVEVDGHRGWMPAPAARQVQRLLWRRVQQRIEAFASGASS